MGRKHTRDTKTKISEKCKGKTSGFKGMKHTEESKRKISESNKGKNLGNQHSLGKKLSDGHKKKLSDVCKGDKHYNWQGGKSFEPYCPKFNEGFKEQIRNKFGRVCLLCGKSEEDNKGRKLSVHHVNYDKRCGCEDSFKCDYVPLCMSCHSKTGNNRSYWENKILKMLI